MYINKDELLELLEKKYGNLTDTCGCNVFVNGEYVWLSVADIVDVIEECDTYEEDDF